MAEGLARRIFGPGVTVQSAGSKPTLVSSFAIKAMAEVGIDISKHSAKALTDIDLEKVDTIITLCEDEVCPALPSGGKFKIHKAFPDPNSPGESDEVVLERFRGIRDVIEKFILELKSALESKNHHST